MGFFFLFTSFLMFIQQGYACLSAPSAAELSVEESLVGNQGRVIVEMLL